MVFPMLCELRFEIFVIVFLVSTPVGNYNYSLNVVVSNFHSLCQYIFFYTVNNCFNNSSRVAIINLIYLGHLKKEDHEKRRLYDAISIRSAR